MIIIPPAQLEELKQGIAALVLAEIATEIVDALQKQIADADPLNSPRPSKPKS